MTVLNWSDDNYKGVASAIKTKSDAGCSSIERLSGVGTDLVSLSRAAGCRCVRRTGDAAYLSAGDAVRRIHAAACLARTSECRLVGGVAGAERGLDEFRLCAGGAARRGDACAAAVLSRAAVDGTVLLLAARRAAQPLRLLHHSAIIKRRIHHAGGAATRPAA